MGDSCLLPSSLSFTHTHTNMSHAALRIGDVAPDFESDSSTGPIKFHDYLGDSWGLFCSHPRDYTPVCTTELGALSRMLPEFNKRNVKVAAISVDSADSHKGWIKDINETQNTEVSYPIVADPNRKIANLYGMLDQTELDDTNLPLTVRAVFIVDPKKIIRLIIIYPASCGRNFDEILRCVDSLQLTSKVASTVTPANWKQGDDLIIAPTVSNAQATELFGNFKEVKPYLRFTAAPK